MAEGSSPDLPFAGLRVVEVATWIAAPVAATILGDLGAEVIKVEPPDEGDPYRGLPQFPGFQDVGVNYTWAMDGRCKRSLTLNLKSPEGTRVLHELVRRCDVYITNQPHPVRERFALTYDDLRPLNERMIYASLTAFGERGPERDRPGFDQVAYWARSGLLDLVRAPGAAPVQGLPGMGDHPSGVSLFAAISTALYRRERTGTGGMVHTSLHGNGLWSNGCMGQAALAGVTFEERRQPRPEPSEDGPAREMSSIQELYECADGGLLQLNMVRSDAQVEALYRVFGALDLLRDPRFATPEGRFENGSILVAKFRRIVRTRPLAEWLELLAAAGAPASHMVAAEEIQSDTQAKVNGVLLDAREADVGMDWIINHPIGLEEPGRGPSRPPEVGEHSDEILAELGYSKSEIERLRERGAI